MNCVGDENCRFMNAVFAFLPISVVHIHIRYGHRNHIWWQTCRLRIRST